MTRVVMMTTCKRSCSAVILDAPHDGAGTSLGSVGLGWVSYECGKKVKEKSIEKKKDERRNEVRLLNWCVKKIEGKRGNR